MFFNKKYFADDKKNYKLDRIFCCHQFFFFLKNTFKVAQQYFFNIFILFYIGFNLQLNFKLKIDPKMRTFKNLEEIRKTWKKF